MSGWHHCFARLLGWRLFGSWRKEDGIMSDITRSEYNELIQKINEIHDMLRTWSRHPNLYPALEPYPKPPWIVTSHTARAALEGKKDE